MNKSKVENGEVIEAFREKFNELVVKESSGEYYAMILPKDIHEDDEYSLIDIEAFITNALNQQRHSLIEKIKDKYPDFIYQEWVEVATPHNFEAGKINETAFDEFLTKLEEEK